MRLVICPAGIGLLYQHPIRSAVPDTRPRLVRPAQAKRKVRLARLQHLGERPLQYASSGEPIVVIAEPLDPVAARHCGLCLAGLRDAKVVEPEVGRNVGLVMASKHRRGLCDVCPLGKPRAPPIVVLGYGVELWQVQGNGTSTGAVWRWMVH